MSFLNCLPLSHGVNSLLLRVSAEVCCVCECVLGGYWSKKLALYKQAGDGCLLGQMSRVVWCNRVLYGDETRVTRKYLVPFLRGKALISLRNFSLFKNFFKNFFQETSFKKLMKQELMVNKMSSLFRDT